MRLKNYLLFIILLSFACPLKAAQLGFGAATFNKDTLHIGDTLFIKSYVHNFDTAAYNDLIGFGLKINGVQNVNQVIFPNPYYNQVVTINPGDSLVANMYIIITSAYCALGPDILVVWPIAHDGSPPLFSIDSQIYVIDRGVGIIEPQDEPRMKAYYANKEVYPEGRDREIDFNQVRIFDVSGREILNQRTDGNLPLPFSVEPGGIYFVEVTYNSGEKLVYKIIK